MAFFGDAITKIYNGNQMYTFRFFNTVINCPALSCFWLPFFIIFNLSKLS